MASTRRDSLAPTVEPLGSGTTTARQKHVGSTIMPPRLALLLGMILVSSSLAPAESAFAPPNQGHAKASPRKTHLNYVSVGRESTTYNSSEASSLRLKESSNPAGNNPLLKEVVSSLGSPEEDVSILHEELNSLLDEAVFFYTEWKDTANTEELVQELQLLIKDLSLALMEEDKDNASSGGALVNAEKASRDSTRNGVAAPPEKKLRLGESKAVQLARKLEEALQQVMEGTMTQEEMELIAQQYRDAKEGKPDVEQEEEEEEELVQEEAPDTPALSFDVLQAFRARLEAIQQKAPQAEEERNGFRSRIKNGVKKLASKVSGRNNNGYSNHHHNGAAAASYYYGPKKVLPKLLFSNNEKPDPSQVQNLLDQATSLFANAPNPTTEREAEDLMEETGHVLFYAKQKDEIVPIGRAIVAQQKDSTPMLVNGRTATQIAQEMEAALQLHMAVGDDHSKSVLDELAEEYKRATERTAITPSSAAAQDAEETTVATSPGSVEVSAKVVVESLQERLSELRQAVNMNMEPKLLGRSSIWEAVVSGYTERTENGFRVTPAPGGTDNDEGAPRTKQRQRNGRKSRFDENGAFVGGGDDAAAMPEEDDNDEFIDVVVLEEPTSTGASSSPVAETPETQQQQQPGRTKDQAIDANILPDKALTLPLNNFLDWTKMGTNANGQAESGVVPLEQGLDTLEPSLEVAQSEAKEEDDEEEASVLHPDAKKFLEEQAPRRELVQQRMKENQLAAEAQKFLQEQEPRRQLVRQRMADNRLAAMMEEFLRADMALDKEAKRKSKEAKMPKVPLPDETETEPTAESTFMDAVTEAMAELGLDNAFGNTGQEEETEEDKAQRMEANRLAAQKFLVEQEPRREIVHQRMKENKLAAEVQNFLEEQEPRREFVHQRMKENQFAADAHKFLQEQEPRREFTQQRMKDNQLASDAQKFLQEQEPRREFVHQRMEENKLAATDTKLGQDTPTHISEDQEKLEQEPLDPKLESSAESLEESEEIELQVQEALDEAESALDFASTPAKPQKAKDNREKALNKMAGTAINLTMKGAIGIANRFFATRVKKKPKESEAPMEPTPPKTSPPLFFANFTDKGPQEAKADPEAPWFDNVKSVADAVPEDPNPPIVPVVFREKKMPSKPEPLSMEAKQKAELTARGLLERRLAQPQATMQEDNKQDSKPPIVPVTFKPKAMARKPEPLSVEAKRKAELAARGLLERRLAQPQATMQEDNKQDPKPPIVPVTFKPKAMARKPEPLSVEAKQKAELTARGLLERRLAQPKATVQENNKQDSKPPIVPVTFKPKAMARKPEPLSVEAKQKAELTARGLLERRLAQPKPTKKDKSVSEPPASTISLEPLDKVSEQSPQSALEKGESEEVMSIADAAEEAAPVLTPDAQKFLAEQAPRREYVQQRMKENQLAAEAKKFLQEQEPRREFVHQRMEENQLANMVQVERVATAEPEEVIVEETKNRIGTTLRDLYQTPRDELEVISPINDVGARLHDIYGKPMHGQPLSYGQHPDDGCTPSGDSTPPNTIGSAASVDEDYATDSDEEDEDDDEEEPPSASGGSQSLNFHDIRSTWVRRSSVSAATYSLFRSNNRVKEGSSERLVKEGLRSLKKLWVGSGLYHLTAAFLRKPLRPGTSRPASRQKFSVSSQVMDDMLGRRHGMMTATSLNSHPQSPVQQSFQGQAPQRSPSSKDRRMLQAAVVAALVYPILLRLMDPAVFLATIFLPHCLMLARNGNR